MIKREPETKDLKTLHFLFENSDDSSKGVLKIKKINPYKNVESQIKNQIKNKLPLAIENLFDSSDVKIKKIQIQKRNGFVNLEYDLQIVVDILWGKEKIKVTMNRISYFK